MHPNQRRIMGELIGRFLGPAKTVYDIGSFNVNGTHRDQIESLTKKYIGADICSGSNVDVLLTGPYDWCPLPMGGCPAIISGSCLEHVEAPWLWATEAYKRLAPGGIIICIVPFTINEHRYPVDCYRYLPDGFRYLFGNHAGFSVLDCAFSTHDSMTDTYFVGMKRH